MRFPIVISRTAIVSAVMAVVLPLVPLIAQAQVPPPEVQARAWLLVDATSNQVLASGNPDERIEPASLTKLMTAYLVFQALSDKKISMDQTVIPGDAVRTVKSDESRMFIEAGKPVTVHDLVYGMIVQSGNDAAIALAELVGGSQANFVNMMDAEAQKMGLKGTHYADVNGMPDPQHYTTAGDLATLSTRLIRDYPEYYKIFSVKEFSYDNIKQPNRNRLLWIDPTVDGLKTGHTKAAGYCLIATAQRPLPNVTDATRRLVVVMMGEPTERARVQDSLKILNYGYQAYDALRLYKAGQTIETARIYKGTTKTVPIGVQTDQYLTVPKGAGNQVKPVLVRQTLLQAPLTAGQQVGVVKVMNGDKELAEFPAVALQAVPQAGLLGQLWDEAWLMFQKK